MSKAVLVSIIIIVFIAIFLGVYFFIGNKGAFMGMKVETLKEAGSQAPSRQVKTGDNITIQYEIWLENGTKVYSSLDEGVPIDFQVGQSMAIKGFNIGFIGMKVGEKRRITIPPELAFGEVGFPVAHIPPNATLITEVELLKIN